MIKKILLIILLFISCFSIAQVDSVHHKFVKPNFNGPYFKSYLLDTRTIFLSPYHWSGKDWWAVSGVVITTGLLSTQDLTVRNYIHNNKVTFIDNLQKYGLERWGSGMYSMPAMALLYSYGAIAKNDRAKKTSLLAVKGYLVSGLIITPIKHIFHRHRPFQTNSNPDPYIFDGPFSHPKQIHSIAGIIQGLKDEVSYTSFPSGHTNSVFTVATILATEYKDKPIIPIVAYSIATLTGLSRMEADKHWLSDVFFGASLGYFMGKMICNTNNWGVQISPTVVGDKVGLNLRVPLD